MAIDWTSDDVQHLVLVMDEVEIEAFQAHLERENDFYARLADALDALPPPTRRQRARFWLEEFVEHLRRYPV